MDKITGLMQEEFPTIVPPNTVADSERKKKRIGKTLAQLPVYRDAANLKFLVTYLMTKSGRKYTKFFDQMLCTVSELKKSIGMADISKNPTDRVWYLECARVLTQDLSDDFIVLRKLNAVVDKDTNNKVKAMVKSVIAQLVAWRDYTRGEGAQPNQNIGAL